MTRTPGDWRASLARWLPAIVLAIIAFTLALDITDPPAPGLDPDAVAYLGNAESLARLGELRTPSARWWNPDSTSMLAHFPPGFAAAIAVPVRLGMSSQQSARLVEALSAFVTVGTLVLLVGDATAPLAGILLAVALLAMSSMHLVHVSVLSEPLFLALTALTLAAMVYRSERPVAAGVLAAIGALVRYAGLSLVGAVALWSFAQRATFVTRVRRALTAALPAVVMQAFWFIRTRQVAATEPIRRLGVYGDFGPSLDQARETIEAWLIPDPDALVEPMRFRGMLTVTAAALLIAVTIAAVRSLTRRPSVSAREPMTSGAPDAASLLATRALAAASLLVGCYLALVVVSRSIADPGIPFDERILSPMILLGTTIVATALAVWWRASSAVLPKLALIGVLLGWWCAAGSVTWDEARQVRDYGSDFGSDDWRRSDLLEWARTDGVRHPLYTNWVAAVYFHLGRPARDVPMLTEGPKLPELARVLRANDGRVLLFTVPGVEYLTVDSLRRAPDLRVVAERADGVVFAAVGEPTRPVRLPTAAP
ncbi:MAG: hypothetical protein ABI601_05455 [bacterium]